jgi:raffinose/stachyose/melibiose transport system substrate-binding protein
LPRFVRLGAGLLGGAALALGVLATPAARARSGDTTIVTMLALSNKEPAFRILIPNFERVHPEIKIQISYLDAGILQPVQAVEIGAGNAPDILDTSPGCGVANAICVLANQGVLAPMTSTPWVKRSMPLVVSGSKSGSALLTFAPTVSPYGLFTNDDLFRKLGLRVPRTFAQLLDLCRKAKAAGTVALLFPGGNLPSVGTLVSTLGAATVYATDKNWRAKLRAGKTTFAGTPGWHAALQEIVDMNAAGCFEPGVAGTGGTSATQQFVQGQGLALPFLSVNKGSVDTANPQFAYSHHPFPAGSDPNQVWAAVTMNDSLSVNAHSSARIQAAAQTFVDFVARPKQNALYAQQTGGLSQFQFIHGQIPAFMSDFADVFAAHRYVIAPYQGWWSVKVNQAAQSAQGLLTGQLTVDDVLDAMDAAWKQGPE